MNFWDFIITFLAGAGVALVPIIVERAWSLINRIRYRDIIKTYTILTPLILAEKLSSKHFLKLSEIIIELARLEAWESLDFLFTTIVKHMTSTEEPRLSYYLGEELTEKWVNKWVKDREKYAEFIEKAKLGNP